MTFNQLWENLKNENEEARAFYQQAEEMAKTMTAIESAVQWAVGIASDNKHGYSQQSRWGPDYDCSSLVISAFEQAGVPVRSRGATYTRNMRSVFLGCGFRDVTGQVNLSNGSGLKRGDVLLNDAAHAALYIGDGKVVHARSSEGNSIQGDQSGNEIRSQNYWDFPWSIVMRLEDEEIQPTERGIRKGDRGEPVVQLQKKLIAAGYDVGPDGADGVFGNNTFRALIAFQEDHGLTVTGEATQETMEAFGPGEAEEKPAPKEWKPGTLETGDVGTEVRLLQDILTCRDYYCTPDGVFGKNTRTKVKQFQKDAGLEETGRCDQETWSALKW